MVQAVSKEITVRQVTLEIQELMDLAVLVGHVEMLETLVLLAIQEMQELMDLAVLVAVVEMAVAVVPILVVQVVLVLAAQAAATQELAVRLARTHKDSMVEVAVLVVEVKVVVLELLVLLAILELLVLEDQAQTQVALVNQVMQELMEMLEIQVQLVLERIQDKLDFLEG